MYSNIFERNISTKRNLSQSTKLLDQQTRDYLLGVSLDTQGSPLKLLLAKSDITTCREFIKFMSKHEYPATETLKLEVKVLGKILTRPELNLGSWKFRTREKIVSNLKWKTLWLGRGYQIGVLSKMPTIFVNESNSTPVYLCTDLRLRCKRSSPIFELGQSHTSGVGTLPTKELPRYSFYPGKFIETFEEGRQTRFREEKLEDVLVKLSEVLL